MQPLVFNTQPATPPFQLSDLPRSPRPSPFVVTAPVAGTERQLLPLRDGHHVPYINLDNAASTTPLPAVGGR